MIVCAGCGSSNIKKNGTENGTQRYICKSCGCSKNPIPKPITNEDVIVIADTQVHKDSPLEHLAALNEYILKCRPKYIVHIGDNWDFPSLSSYSNKKDAEGRRLFDDLQSGFNALDTVTKNFKSGSYNPELHFVFGNHENRLERFIDNNPLLDGFFNLEKEIEKRDWKVSEYLKPLWINGICYIHYLPNPESSKPIGGSIDNKMNKINHSFVHGHQQKFQFGRRQNMLGQPQIGVCAGSFYLHDEKYRGANNTEIRGIPHLRSFENRFDYLDHDVEFVSMERLMRGAL